MKRITLITLISICTITVKAQLGITAGFNLAKYSYKADPSSTTDRKALLAYNIGIQYRKTLSEKIVVQPELGYTLKGTRLYPSYPIGFTGPMKYLNRLSYLQVTVPVIASLPLSSMADEGDTKFELGAGLFAGTLLNATVTAVEFDDTKSKTKYSIGGSASDDFTRMDYGLQLIAGCRLMSAIGVHLKYDMGFRNIEPNPAFQAIRSRNISLNVSWLFVK